MSDKINTRTARPMPEILAELQQAVDEVCADRLRYGHIADTIRVNALRYGATDAQAEDFVHGRADFIGWAIEAVGANRLAAERDACRMRAEQAEARERALLDNSEEARQFLRQWDALRAEVERLREFERRILSAIEPIQSDTPAAVAAAIEAAAVFSENAMACQACGEVFDGHGEPHEDSACGMGYVDWDIANRRQIAAKIRSLIEPTGLAALNKMLDAAYRNGQEDAMEAAAVKADSIDAKAFRETYEVEYSKKRYDTLGVQSAVNNALNIQAEDAAAAIRALPIKGRNHG